MANLELPLGLVPIPPRERAPAAAAPDGPPAGASPSPLAGVSDGHELARAYLAEFGLAASQAAELERLGRNPDLAALDLGRLTDDERAQFENLSPWVTARVMAARVLLAGHQLRAEDDQAPGATVRFLSPVGVAEVRHAFTTYCEVLRITPPVVRHAEVLGADILDSGEADIAAARAVCDEIPGFRERLQEYDRLRARIALTPNEVAARLECLRTRPGGGAPAPTLTEWLAARQIAAPRARDAVAALDTAGAEDAGTSGAGGATAAPPTPVIESLVQPSRLVIPDAVRRGWLSDRHRHLEERVTAAERPGVPKLIAPPGAVEQLRARATQVGAREFSDLSQTQIRALTAALSLLDDDPGADTSAGRMARDTARARWADVCRRAQVDPRQPVMARALLGALYELADRRVHFELIEQREEGQILRFLEGELFQVSVEFTAEEERRDRQSWERRAEKQRAAGEPVEVYAPLFERWQRWRGQRGSGEWDGPMPYGLTFLYPPYVRRLDGALVFHGNVLGLLLKGEKTVGQRSKLGPLTWPLLMEIVSRRQARQYVVLEGPDGARVGTARSYVNRDRFIAEYRKESWENQPGRALRYYDDAVEVLLASGLVLEVERHKMTDDGPRDVFIPSPELVHGLSSRALRTAEKAATRERALGTGAPSRRAPRPREDGPRKTASRSPAVAGKGARRKTGNGAPPAPPEEDAVAPPAKTRPRTPRSSGR